MADLVPGQLSRITSLRHCPAAITHWYNDWFNSQHQFTMVLLFGDDQGGITIIRFFKDIHLTAIDPNRQDKGTYV